MSRKDELARVHISDKAESLNYEESIGVEEDTIHLPRHSSTELIRIEDSDDHWSNKYYYLFCSILIGINNNIFPLSMKLAFQLSGGALILVLITFSLFIGLPLMYMETFFGRYTKLTNCQMYRMAPIFFGVSLIIFSINIMYLPVHVMSETQVLVNLLNILANPTINDKCAVENGECYDYMKKGKVNDKCRYGYVSIICEKLGEIRYLLEYEYWQLYANPTSARYPYYQMIIAVVLTWMLILIMVMKRIQVLGWIVHTSFVIYTMILILIFALALAKEGSSNGLYTLTKVDFKNFSLYQVFLIQWHSLSRLGLIIPIGHMTSSAYTRFRSSVATDCCIVIFTSLVLTGFYLIIFFAICGVIANAMGVDVDAVFVPDRGLYLAIVPQFLTQLQVPNIFLIVYYGSLWFFETVKTAFYIHLLILNLYDYFPNLKNFASYIWVTTCLVMCFASIPMCDQQYKTTFIPAMLVIYQIFGIGIFITLEITMVSYFYGVNRLSNDIHFDTGQQPIKFWKIMWYIIPFIGWYSLIMTTTMPTHVRNENENLGIRSSEMGWLYAALVYSGLGFLGIVSTIMYISFRFQTPNLLLTLLKPQYFWGPSGRDIRVKRKRFRPCTYIRSQPIFHRRKRETERRESDQHGEALISQFSKDVLVEQAIRADHLKDKVFFERIGLYSELDSSIRKDAYEAELDIQDAS